MQQTGSLFQAEALLGKAKFTMRMHMRRFTSPTNAFSKKLENHCHDSLTLCLLQLRENS